MRTRAFLLVSVILIGLVLTAVASKPVNANFQYIHWPSSENNLSQVGSQSGAPALLYKSGTVYMIYGAGNGPVSDLQILSSTDLSTWTSVTTLSGSRSHGGKIGFIYNPGDQKYYITYQGDLVFVDIPTPSGVDFTADVPMMVVRSSSDLVNWSKPINMTWEFNGGFELWDVNGPTIVLDSANNRLLVEYAKTIGSPCTCKEVFLNQSYGPNFGQTWSTLSSSPVSYGGSPIPVNTTPDLKYINGKLFMAYVDPYSTTRGGAIHLVQSTDGITWTNKVDIAGQTADSAVIDYSSAEAAFHLMWVGTDGSHTINDMSSSDALSWSTTTQQTFDGHNGSPLALSELYPSLTFDATRDILVMAHTGTDYPSPFALSNYMHVLPEVGAVNDAGFVSLGGSSLFQSTTTSSGVKPNQGTFVEQAAPTNSCAGCGVYIVETDTTRYHSRSDTYVSFIGFSPNIPANSVISKATLSLTAYDVKTNLCLNLGCPMSLSIISSSWTAANVNWNSQPSTSCFSGCGEIDAGLVTKGQTFTTDVSSMVNQAYAAGQFYGIKIAPNPTCGSGLCEDWYVDYYSQLSASTGPILTITYTYTPSSATLCAGQQAPIMVTMNNRGSTIWQPSTSLPTAPFRLGSQNPPDNTLWGNSRIDLTSAVSVQSNSVFSFTVTAPSTTGTYNLQYQMVQDYPETWFGDLTSNIPVTVTPPCQPDFTLTATNPPAANVGATAITILTISSVNSFSGTVSLTDTVPTGLSCGTINPSTVTSSGGSAVSCSGSYAGAFPVTITGTSGSLTHSVTVNFSSMDFTISSSSPSASVQPNGSGTSTINLSSVNGFASGVSLSAGAQSIYATPALDGWGSGYCHSTSGTQCAATLTTKTAGDLIVVFASSPTTLSTGYSISDSAGLSFNSRIFAWSLYQYPWQEISVQEFWAVSTTSLTSDTITMTTHDPPGCCSGHNLELIAFGVSGSNNQFDGSASSSIQSSGNPNLSVSTGGSNRMVIAYAVDGSQSLTAGSPFILIGSAGNDGSEYLMSPSPQSTTVSFGNAQGEWAEVADVIQPAPGFSLSFAPQNVPLTSGGTSSSVVTITPKSFVPLGTYSVSVTGTIQYSSHTVPLTVSVANFGVSASPTTISVNSGSAGASTITVNPVGSFSGTVNLTANNGSCSLTPTSVVQSGTSTLSCSLTTATTYVVSITGTSGSESHTTAVTYLVRDFTIVASPTSLSVNAGVTASSTITVTPLNWFMGTVSLSFAPLPTGLSCGAINPASVNLSPPPAAATATFSCSSVSAGIFPITIIGTSGSLTRNSAVTFTFMDFTVSANPTSVATNTGASGTSTITVAPVNGFTGTVTLTSSPSPATGLTCTLTRTSVSLGVSQTSALACTGSAGIYTITATGASGSLSHTATVTVTVRDFALTSSPTSVTKVANAAGTSTITVTPVNGFTGTVALTATVSGLTCSLSPTAVTLGASGTSTLSCVGAEGTYTVNVSGGSAGLTRTATVAYTVTGFTITALPTTVTVNAGTAGTSTVTIASVNGFTGTVSLTVSASTPSGLTCSVPSSVTFGTSPQTVTLSCSASTTTDYSVTVTGTTGSLSHSTGPITFHVVDFSFSAAPSSASLTLASSLASSTVTVGSINGYSAGTSLTVSSSPGGLVVSIWPTSVTPPAGGTATSRVSISAGGASPGTYTVSVIGTSGSRTHSTTITVTLTGDFGAGASPASVSVQQGSSTTSSITLNSLNGFSGTVSSGSNAAVTINAVDIDDGNYRSFGLIFDQTLYTADFWNQQPSSVIGTASGAFNYANTYNLPKGSHYLEFGVSAWYGHWHAKIYINGVLMADVDTNVMTHVHVAFQVGGYSVSPNVSNGPTATFNPTSVTLSSGGTAPLTMTISTQSTTPTGTYTFTVPLTSAGISHSVTITATVLAPKYTLTFQGYDYDGQHEETLTLNSHQLVQLPAVDSSQNAGVYTTFSVDMTSLAVKGSNTLVFTHANWDCGVVDNTKNIVITDAAGVVIFSDPTVRPLSCTQSITYTFTI